ncbi:BMP family ABC transporter substrate-binding protein [Streptomyces sp. MZ04]|uniref:BMP family lipoprotein n=1 Tax=Streptomyces sp. MZ04 TaxID=2559236 RepID=UPI00107EBAA6|nr:BMP family ABC transporter substrate-binding protein [Streptomyces sp. MZ04]TGA94477.1 BMP family ABC transporter substrate-binding protein [Streptomyces sp. MZ04]
MRRVSKIAAASVATAALALSATACGGTSSDAAGSKSDGKGKGVAIAYDVGGKGDQSFNDAATAGMDKAAKDLKVGKKAVEPTDGESDADKAQRLTELAKQGYNPVIGIGYAYAPAVKEVAAKFPKVTFGIVDDATIKADNVSDLVFNEEQSSYLAGVTAAKATKSKTVGFIGGVDNPLIRKFEAGFVQGVQDTDKSVKIKRQFLTEKAEDGGFSSPDKGKEGASGQIEDGADVVYHAAGLSGQGVIEAAAAEKVWAIGVDSDQYQQKALDKYKKYILTSATKDVTGAVYNLTKSVQDGNAKGGVVRADLASGGVALADSNPEFKNMKDLQAALKKAEQGITSGKIKVKTAL